MSGVGRQRKSRRYIWQGFLLLTLGSALLLGCKLTGSPWLHSALLFGGGGSILLGNGYMLYGLLHHADSRNYQGEVPADKGGSVVGDASAQKCCETPTASAPLPVKDTSHM